MKISIEGIPGSGKTTILKILLQMGYNCVFSSEDSNDLNNNITRANESENEVRIVEGSFLSDKIVSGVEPPDYIILLDCQPDCAIKRFSPDKGISALHITQIYMKLEWILHPVNCNIPVYRINASNTIFHTLHLILEVLKKLI